MWTEGRRGGRNRTEWTKWTGRSFITGTSAGALTVSTVAEKVGVGEGLGQPASRNGEGCGNGTGPVDGPGREMTGEGGGLFVRASFFGPYAS